MAFKVMIDQTGVGAALVDSVRAEVARRALSDSSVGGRPEAMSQNDSRTRVWVDSW